MTFPARRYTRLAKWAVCISVVVSLVLITAFIRQPVSVGKNINEDADTTKSSTVTSEEQTKSSTKEVLENISEIPSEETIDTVGEVNTKVDNIQDNGVAVYSVNETTINNSLYSENVDQVGEDGTGIKGSFNQTRVNHKVSSRSHVILNSYMRSGSSFMGELLGHRDETLYYYEPLYKSGTWYYWRGDNQTCHIRSGICRRSSPDGVLSKLKGAFQCEEDGLTKTVTAISLNNGGQVMGQVKQCWWAKDMKEKRACIDRLVSICRSSRYRVAKVLRMALDGVARLLDTDRKLKIVHLFRDPRAIINSRLKTVWYKMDAAGSAIKEHAQQLCERMSYDAKAARALAATQSARFRVILYETIMSDLEYESKKLLKFLNIEFTKADQEKMNFITGASDNQYVQDTVRHSRIVHADREKDYSFWWRTNMPWKTVVAIDKECREVYELLGYRHYKGERELRNMTIPGFVK